MRACLKALLFLSFVISLRATSMKMDFLEMTTVRTDPITNPNSLSPHLHRFFGATAAAPNTTFEDLRNATGNTGNVEENLSLYWHPAIYRYDPETELFSLVETSLFSTYYIWPTGETTAFPDGFKMIGGGYGYEEESMPFAECVDRGECPDDDCTRWNEFFPAAECAELEMSMRMPNCWDGVNLDSPDHRSHVAYAAEGDADGECPDGFPVRLPQIRVFTRIQPYSGGIHLFSDGTGYFHADYFSGWDENELQTVLNDCENDSWEAMPTSWCEDFVTFRDAPKNPDSTEVDLSKLEAFQPEPPFDPSSITNEPIDNVRELPGGIMPDIDENIDEGEEEGSAATLHSVLF